MSRWFNLLDAAADHESWLIPQLYRAPSAQVFYADWIVEDFLMAVEDRIVRRFAEMGVHLSVPRNLPELRNPPRRSRSIWL